MTILTTDPTLSHQVTWVVLSNSTNTRGTLRCTAPAMLIVTRAVPANVTETVLNRVVDGDFWVGLVIHTNYSQQLFQPLAAVPANVPLVISALQAREVTVSAPPTPCVKTEN